MKNSVTSLLAYTTLNPNATIEELTQQVVSSEGNIFTVGGSSTADFTICISNPNTPDFTYGYNSATGLSIDLGFMVKNIEPRAF